MSQEPVGIPKGAIEPLPKYTLSLSPEGWIKQAGVLKPEASGKNVHWTVDPSVELPIKISTDPKSVMSRPPKTVMDVFNATVAACPDEPALRVRRNNKWQTLTWTGYRDSARAFAKACINAGHQRHEAVCIIGFNSPEWIVANIGAILAGGLASGIYTTNSAEATWYVAHHSDSSIAVAEDEGQVEKFLSTRDRLPRLKRVVQYTGEVKNSHGGFVVSWVDFIKSGAGVSEEALEDRIRYQRPGHCCTLIYTSGTTGNPKAVMLSHDNLTWTTSSLRDVIDVKHTDRLVSYLPLSHVAAQIIDIHAPMLVGACISFAQPDALKGSLVVSLQDVRPTIFFAVPRVWEKIEEKMRAVGAAGGPIKQAIGTWAKQLGVVGSFARIYNQPMPWGWTIAEKVVYSNIKKALGLDECRYRATAAAPISKETLEYFMSLDLHILEVYGMSESSGPHTINSPGHTLMYSVGRPFPGAYHKLDQPDAKGNGHIMMWGRHVFMGYLKAEKETAETIDKDGFNKTGDLGRVNEQGYLYITGRIKELIITAGGENVAPVLIEDAVKAELPIISNIMVVGDKRKFLGALVTLKTDPDQEGNPGPYLTEAVCTALKGAGVSVKHGKTTTADVRKDPAVTKFIQQGIDRANKNVISSAQRVSKWSLLAKDFSLNEELTPTMKLKRRVVVEKYAAEIEALYAEDGKSKL